MRALLHLLCLAALLPLPARAADPAFTPAQHDAIVAIMRQALKTDPSILREAIQTLEADNQARQVADTRSKIAEKRQALTATFGDPVAGNPNGDVTVVEFYDPRCPYCRRVLPDIAALLKKDPQLRWVYKDIPVLGPASTTEARAIVAAQKQGAYLKMQAALMATSEQPSDDSLRETARSLGLDADKLLADMTGKPVTDRIEANLALARYLDIQGTPAFVIGDQVIPGAVDAASLTAAIAAARKAGSQKQG